MRIRWYVILLAIAGVIGLATSTAATKTEGEPKSPKVHQLQAILGDGQLVVFCDQERGNLLYVFVTTKGSSIAVIPGGCGSGQ